MEQYPADFRDRLRRALDAGLARAEAARTFGVAERTIRRWQRQRRQAGGVAPAPRRGRARTVGPADEPALAAQGRARPDATLAGHCDRWAAERGARVSPATMSRALARLGLPLKKRRRSPGSATRPSAPPGGRKSRPSTRPTWCSSARPPRRRR